MTLKSSHQLNGFNWDFISVPERIKINHLNCRFVDFLMMIGKNSFNRKPPGKLILGTLITTFVQSSI